MDDSTTSVMKSEPIKLPDHTQPSDYSDVQPKSYDPDFISQISSQMQVPHRIAVDNEQSNGLHGATNGEQYTGMMVPDRIVLAGDNQHIEMRSDLALDLKPEGPAPTDSMAYVSLLTPPRTLTMNETFPVVDVPEEKNSNMPTAAQDRPPVHSHTVVAGNGHVPAPVPYEPGVNPHDSLLLTEDDEATVLRTQVAKLTRRVQVIEQEHQKRAQRELVLYPVILGYLLWKVLGWLVRDR